MSNGATLNVRTKKQSFKIKNSACEEVSHTAVHEDTLEMQLQRNYERGFADGEQSVRNELKENYERRFFDQKKMLQSVIASVNEQLIEYEQQFDSLVLQLSFLVSEKIIKREIETKSIINETLTAALKKVIGANKVIIKLNRFDLAEIKENADTLFSDDMFSKITFESEERIERGGCLVETEIGNVETRINSQLNELKKQLEHHLFNKNL